MQENRADIKDRMLRAASAAWGYTDKIREADFDPLLGLLMEVFSAELEKMSNEISMSRERVLQKMVQLMAPDVLTAPVPAHAILHAQALGEQLLINDREQFYLTGAATGGTSFAGQPSRQSSGEEIWFSPAGGYYVTDTAVKYMLTGDRISRYINPVTRENWWPLKAALPSHTIWLGLTGKASAIKNAQFYFELYNTSANATFYHHLPDAQWWCGEQTLDTKRGFNSPVPGEGELAGWLRAPHNISQAADRLTRSLYEQRFVHVVGAAETAAMPGELSALLPDTVAAQWKSEPLTWIRIEFPEGISSARLADLHCQINCFPVINRQLHDLTYRLREWINIIPLSCERGHQFLDLQTVTDQEGDELMIASGQEKNTKKLSVLLRKGGAGRFDERDAKAVTEHLLQLLRDESAAFTLYDREFVAGEIKQVQQVINRIYQQIETRETVADATPYLEVLGAPSTESRHLSVSYWSTQGARANLIKGGTALMAYKNGGLRQSSIFLMTMTQGGRQRLLPHESIPAYKSAVLSKDRILSAEDIRLFCIRETGVQPRSIAVKKGVMIAQGRQSGYIKTIDVAIALDSSASDKMQETGTLEHWQQVLQTKLGERSMSFMPFRVFFQ